MTASSEITTQPSTTAANGRAGVYGYDSSTNKGKFNSGVYGVSTYGVGVNGKGATYGVTGTASGSGTGVFGTSTGSGPGGVGTSKSGVGGEFSSVSIGGISVAPAPYPNGYAESDFDINGNGGSLSLSGAYSRTNPFTGDLFQGVGCEIDEVNPIPQGAVQRPQSTRAEIYLTRFGGPSFKLGEPRLKERSHGEETTAAYARV